MKEIHCFIVDDEKDAVERMAILLSKFEAVRISGMETDPEQAVIAIIGKNPDLVFADVEMPKLSGFDLVKRIREKGADPGIIFVTGYDQYAIRAIKNEAFDYLVKPVDIDDLKESLDRFQANMKYRKAGEKRKPAGLPDFTERELEIIPLLARGRTSREIADALNISKNTVDTHRKNILSKAGLHKTSELTKYAIESGLI